MKRILILLSILGLSYFGKSQGVQTLGTSTSTVNAKGGFLVDSMFVLPLIDTFFPPTYNAVLRKTGAMVIKGTNVYYYNGSSWIAFSTGTIDTTSLSNRINERVKYSDSNTVYVPKYGVDTARTTINSNINARVKYTDTATMLAPYLRGIDTASLSSRINLKLNISDTATMLTPYLRKVDTTAMLLPYLRKVDTVSLSNRITSIDTNALKTNTPMSTTLDTVQRNGVNSALHLSTIAVKLLSNGIGGTAPYSNGLHMVNYSPATGSALANQQVSPGLLLEGQGWATFSGASQSVRFNIYTNPGSGVTNPIGNLIFSASINNAPENNPMFLSNKGQLTVDSSLTVTDGTIDIAGTQSINVGSYHGIHNDAGFTSTGASDWKGYWMSGTITQSGGGSGITRGIYLNPVVTTTADYRAIETTNSIGKSIVTGSAPSTFGGTITFPTPFTLGATSVTSTGTQLNYLSSATGTTGTTSTNLVFSTSPTLVTPNLGTPSALVGTNITGTASGLTAGNVTTNANLTGVITSVGNATSIASQTGTGSKFVVDNTPTLITPVLGVASATSLNTGTTLNGTIFAKSANVLSLATTNHALTAGNEASGVNLAIGLYSTSTAIQARSNGASSNIFMNPLGGTVQVGDGSLTGQRLFSIINTGSGTGDWSSIEVRNAAASTDAIRMYCLGTGFTTSGTNVQDAGVLTTGTNISGGMSIGTQASADLRFYSNNTLRTTIQAGGNTIHTARVQLSKGANVASAGDLTLGSAGNSFSITGTTTINAITTTNWQAGSVIRLIFASTPTVKHNTAGGASTAKMLLNGGVDFSATANDVLTLIYDGTNWLECSRSIN